MGINNIEYKQNYNIIHLAGGLVESGDMSDLKSKIDDIISSDEETHIIISLREVDNISLDICAFFENIHQEMYERGISLVFAEPNENVLIRLKQEQLHLVLNITPTIVEACDIINMEILERDILNEE